MNGFLSAVDVVSGIGGWHGLRRNVDEWRKLGGWDGNGDGGVILLQGCLVVGMQRVRVSHVELAEGEGTEVVGGWCLG